MLLLRHGPSQINIRILQRSGIVCIFIFGRFGMRSDCEKSNVPMLTIKSYSLTEVSSYSPAAVLGFLSGDFTPYDIYRGKV